MKTPKIVNRQLPVFRKVFYMKDVNMLYSFKTLERIAHKMKADLQAGDVLIVDNTKGNRRKAFFKTFQGSLIVYGDLKSKNFSPLSKRKSTIQSSDRPLLEYFLDSKN